MREGWPSRFSAALQWVALAGAMAFALARYTANLLAWPANVSVQQ
jgi:hypothetical protein